MSMNMEAPDPSEHYGRAQNGFESKAGELPATADELARLNDDAQVLWEAARNATNNQPNPVELSCFQTHDVFFDNQSGQALFTRRENEADVHNDVIAILPNGDTGQFSFMRQMDFLDQSPDVPAHARAVEQGFVQVYPMSEGQPTAHIERGLGLRVAGERSHLSLKALDSDDEDWDISLEYGDYDDPRFEPPINHHQYTMLQTTLGMLIRR